MHTPVSNPSAPRTVGSVLVVGGGTIKVDLTTSTSSYGCSGGGGSFSTGSCGG